MSDVALVLVRAPDGSPLKVGTTLRLFAGAEVGRDPSTSLLLADQSVSRRHVCVHGGPQGLEVENVSSNNGLFLDGVSVPPGARRALGTARRIQIGGLLFEVHDDASTRPVNQPLTLTSTPATTGPLFRIVTDGDACTVQLRGHHLDVSANAARALRALARAPGQVVHEWDIQTEVGNRSNVAQLMSSIRRAFKAALAQKQLSEDEVRLHLEAARVGTDLESVANLSGAALLRRYLWARRGHGYVWMIPKTAVELVDE